MTTNTNSFANQIARTIRTVESGAIASLGWSRKTGELTVTFKSGQVFNYVAVPQGVYQRFLKAASKGKFYHANIRRRYAGYKISNAA